MGVEVFFVLSGFLITWLLIKESDKTGDVSLLGFYKRRALRIFPAFYVFLFFGLAIILVRHSDGTVPWAHIASAFFYVSNYYHALNRPDDSYVTATWSLSIEEQFYLLWPFLFSFFKNRLETMTKILLGIIGLVWIHRAMLHLGFGIHPTYLYHAFDTRADELMVGCLLAVLIKRETYVPLWRALCRQSYYPLITIILLAVSSMFHYNPTYRFVFGYAIEPILIAALIVQLIYFSDTFSWRFIEWPWVKYLGRISYSLYLYQAITLFTARRLTQDRPVLVQLVFAIGITVLFASASYFIIEKPFLKLRDKKLSSLLFWRAPEASL